MSLVDLKIWQCPLSLFLLDFPVDFKIVHCRLSNLRNNLCYVSKMLVSKDFMSPVDFEN